MLTQTKSDSNKIAMGLLSYAPSCDSTQDICETIAWYDSDDNRQLYLYKEGLETDYIGLVGIERTADQILIVRVLTVNPSYRNEGYAFKILDELQDLYSDYKITSTLKTKEVISEWKDRP